MWGTGYPGQDMAFGRDDDDSFDSIFYGSKKICDRDRWNELTNVSDKIHNYPMDSTNGICYQVFKITRGNADNRELTDKNLVLDILEETMRGFTFWSGFSQDIYKFAKICICIRVLFMKKLSSLLPIRPDMYLTVYVGFRRYSVLIISLRD